MTTVSIPRKRKPALAIALIAVVLALLGALLGQPANAQPTPKPPPAAIKLSAADQRLKADQKAILDPQADDGLHPELTAPAKHVGETTAVSKAMRMASSDSVAKAAQVIEPTPAERVGGRWRYAPGLPTTLNAMHGYWLPDGRLMAMAGSGNNVTNFKAGTFQTYICNALIENCHKIVTPVDMFCSAGIVRNNGDVLIAGGTLSYGAWKGAKYMYRLPRGSNTLQRLTAMQVGRWYPDMVTLVDGRTLIVGGIDQNGHHTNTSEVVSATSYSHRLIGARRTFPLYARLTLNDKKNLFYPGVGLGGYTDNIAPGYWNPNTNSYKTVPGLGDRANRANACSAYVGDVRNQDLWVIGGGPRATNTTYHIKLSARSPRFTRGPDLPFKAFYHSCLTLPNGTLMVFGGGSANKIANANYKVAYLDRSTGKFRLWNNLPAGNHRLYHSVAMLLPNGDVASWGSNPQGEALSTSMQMFTPPSQLGAKPTLVSVPRTIKRYSKITVKVSGGATRLSLTRPPSPTHGSSPDDRFMDFPIRAGGKVDLSPAWARRLQSGYYYACALNTHGSADRSRWTYSPAVTVHYG